MLVGTVFMVIFLIFVGLWVFNMIPENIKTPLLVVLIAVYLIIGGAYIVLKDLEQTYAERYPQDKYLI